MRLLISYHYARSAGSLDEVVRQIVGEVDPGHLELFLDSGAFSAWTQNARVDAVEYARWVAEAQFQPSVIANLDAIGHDNRSAEESWRNWRTITGYGVRAIPVVHVGESLEWLERYVDEGATYIALGGLVGKPWTVVRPWCIRAHQLAEGRASLHGFGLTGRRPLRELPWYSVDSSSWGAGYRYGNVSLFDGDRLVTFTTSDRSSIANSSRSLRFVALARAHGFDPEDLRNPSAESLPFIVSAGVEAWTRYETVLRRRRPVPSCDPIRPPGLRLYLADADLTNLHAAYAYGATHHTQEENTP